jgi:hypothetical protein
LTTVTENNTNNEELIDCGKYHLTLEFPDDQNEREIVA